MKNAPYLFAAGVAALAVAGIVGAQFVKTHTMTVRLPDGGEAHVFYSGNTPPQVAFGTGAAPVATSWSQVWDAGDSPFAEMDRVSAEMDREAAMMLREAADPMPMVTAPAGAQGYSFVSTLSGSGLCSRSIEVISDGRGDKPRIISHTSGDCGAPAPSGQTAIDRAPAPAKPSVIAARYDVPVRS